MIKLQSKKSIETNIETIKTNAGELQALLHTTAVQTMFHHFEYGDTTLANTLVDALPKSIRKADLLRWFVEFGALDYDIKTKTLIHNKDKAKTLDKDTQIQLANDTPFYDLNKDKEVIRKTFLDMLKELERKAVYDIEKRKESHVFTINDLSDIRKLITIREQKQA